MKTHQKIFEQITPFECYYVGCFMGNIPLYLLKHKIPTLPEVIHGDEIMFGLLGVYDHAQKKFHTLYHIIEDFSFLNGGVHGKANADIFETMKHVSSKYMERIDDNHNLTFGKEITETFLEIGIMIDYLKILTNSNSRIVAYSDKEEIHKLIYKLYGEITFHLERIWNIVEIS